jgi:hypothetical protein
MKNTLLFSILLLGFISCSKEEFAVNKGTQSTSLSALDSTTNKLCSQSTLISPQVDILMLWDNSSSFNFVTSATKASMSNLITSVSENFDYHILSLPLVPANSTQLYEGTLVAKNNAGLTGTALGIVKTKEAAVANLAFTQGNGGQEVGIDRATQVIEQNRTNGIFRNGAYTIIVVMSNEDDKGCELNSPYASCAQYDVDQYINPRITKLLCLRGNTFVNCSASGISSPLNSSMMRYINIAPLTACSNGLNKINSRYRKVAKSLYEAPYSNSWPTSNDHLSPDIAGAFDSYNLCTIDFSHIFDGVNTAIKQTLLKHKYDYWPVAGSNTSLDPATLRVVRSDGKVLANRTGESSPTDGFGYVGAQTSQNTRFFPTAGEPFTGKMIQLFGSDGNDKIVYPDCLTVEFKAEKTTYGYIYLKYGEPVLSSIELRINGNLVPQNATNGWSYMGLQYTNALDSNLKIAESTGESSGYYLRLNGTYKVSNTNSNTISVFYNSANQ